MTSGPRVPWLGRALLRAARLRRRRDECEADLRELFESRAHNEGIRAARRRYVADAASVWRGSWFSPRAQGSPAVRATALFGSVGQDLRFGLRLFRRQTSVMFLAIVGLALAMGVNTAVFSILNLAIRPVGVAHPDRAVVVNRVRNRPTPSGLSVSTGWPYGDYLQMRPRVTQVALEAWLLDSVRLSVPGTTAVDLPMRVSFVSGGFFSTFGGHAVLGRTILPSDDDPSSPPVVVLSHAMWRARFASDATIVGRTVQVSGVPATVVGVAARDFTGLLGLVGAPSGWMALGSASQVDRDLDPFGPSSTQIVNVAGLLAPAATMASAEAEASPLAAGLAELSAHPSGVNWSGVQLTLVGLDWSFDRVLTVALTMGMFSSVLILACANIANLLLANATTRRTEIASRLALGATRGRIVRQLLTESVGIGVGAGLLGLLLAFWALPTLARVGLMPGDVDLGPDWRVYWFTAGSALVAGVLSGLAAARHGASGDVLAALKGTAGGVFEARPGRARGVFLAVQAAVCTCLLVVVALFGRALVRQTRSDYGFDVDHFVRLSLYAARSSDSQRIPSLYALAQDRLRSFPGVRSIDVVDGAPFERAYTPATLTHEGRQTDAGYVRVSAGFFSSMGLTVLRGRTFSDEEVRVHAPVAVISARMARELFGGADPIGAALEPAGRTVKEPAGRDLVNVHVVGVVSDVVFRPTDPDKTAVYRPVAPDDLRDDALLWIRTRDNPSAVVQAMHDAVAALDPIVHVSVLSAADERDRLLLPVQGAAAMLGTLGGLALVLSVVGIFGVTSFVGGQRLSELSVRLALGATRSDLTGLLMRDTLRPIAVGLVCGLGGALLLGQWLSTMVALSVISPRDPVAMTAAVVVLGGTAIVAALLPARRAVRIDPARVLRHS